MILLHALLHRRAWHITKRAEDTAVIALGLKQRMARFAFVEPLAGIGRHHLLLAVAAVRAGDGGFSDHA